MSEIKMLTITQWIKEGLTDLTARELQKKAKKGEFEGVEVVGKTLRFPDTEANKEVAKRKRAVSSQKRNKTDDSSLT